MAGGALINFASQIADGIITAAKMAGGFVASAAATLQTANYTVSEVSGQVRVARNGAPFTVLQVYDPNVTLATIVAMSDPNTPVSVSLDSNAGGNSAISLTGASNGLDIVNNNTGKKCTVEIDGGLSPDGNIKAGSKAGAIVVGDIPAGQFKVWKDTTGGSVKLYYNDAGTLKSVALT